MKTILIASVALLLAGCALGPTLPTSVNPGVTDITNTAMALVAASSGDCTVQITAPSVATQCAPLPDLTTTVAQAQAAFQGCVAAAVGSRLSNQAAALQAALCAKAGPAPPPSAFPRPPVVPAK
jgi:uncharacterized lipoprotein YmbA